MAVVSRVAQITLTDGVTGSTRTWRAEATVQDTAAGGLVTINFTSGSTGAAAAGTANSLRQLRVETTGGTVLRTYTWSEGASSDTFQFYLTADGQSGSAARSGTLQMVLRVTKTNGGPTATYDVESDGSPNTPPTGHTATTADKGWIRATTTATVAVSNIALGGSKVEPAVFGESVFARMVLAAPPFQSRALTATFTGTSKSAASSASTSATKDVTFSGTSTATGRVNIGFPAADGTYTCTIATPGNDAVTGQPWTSLTSITTDTLRVDPRLTCAHLLQLDDNSYGSPPLSKLEASGERPATSIGYLGTHFRHARGDVVGDVTSGGVNGIAASITLTAQRDGSSISRAASTTAEGGEDGWTSGFMTWTSQLPGGAWDKAVTITGPSDVVGASYLLNGTAEYSLLANRNPFIEVVAGGGMAGEQADHFSAGAALLLGVSLFNTRTAEVVEPDSDPAPVIALMRFDPATGLGEYLDTDYAWKALGAGAVPTWSMAQSPTDPRVWVASFSAAQTAGWGDVDFFAVVALHYEAVAYSSRLSVAVTGASNPHAGYGVDALDLALNGTISTR